ncbi:RluA family pseudouridine synthase [Alkalibacterium iburiense]|uniref:RNA pseudouridylate synthase n=1 Tax=Alkalibacterium iburiense TaxID=290589 RepID=A0ABN0XS42_9LACT
MRYQKPGNVYLGLVHRLDRPVGGAMVFAKTSKAASRLSDMVRRYKIERVYLAVVHGTPKEKEGELVHFLYKNKKKNQVFVSTHPKAKKAILNYTVLESKNGLSLLAVKLKTGRPHQIRVQLATTGHPIVGDQKYNQPLSKPGQQIALWAYTLTFEHPVRKEPVKGTSRPPNEYLWNLWEIEKTSFDAPLSR